MEWIFNGIGTELIVGVISLLIGGFGGYKIGINKKLKQIQVAKDDAKQIQIGSIKNEK